MPDSLHALNLRKQYNQSTVIFDGLNVDFKPGTATGLIGANGSGKTTLLRILTTVAYPTSGKVLLGELNIHEHPHQYLSHLGFGFDSSELPMFANTVEVLEAILKSRNKWSEDSHSQINGLLEMLDLDERRNNLIGTYSSGMMQKALIAMALIADPDIILLDEPFRALDEATVGRLKDYLISQKEAGKIIILSSHNSELIKELCDSVIEFPYQK